MCTKKVKRHTKNNIYRVKNKLGENKKKKLRIKKRKKLKFKEMLN